MKGKWHESIKTRAQIEFNCSPHPPKREFSVGVCINEEDTTILFGTPSTTKFEELKAYCLLLEHFLCHFHWGHHVSSFGQGNHELAQATIPLAVYAN